LRPEHIFSPSFFSLLLRQILFERKIRKTSLPGVDRRVIAGFKHQAATILLKYDGRASF
jgi:hypothetical protein